MLHCTNTEHKQLLCSQEPDVHRDKARDKWQTQVEKQKDPVTHFWSMLMASAGVFWKRGLLHRH